LLSHRNIEKREVPYIHLCLPNWSHDFFDHVIYVFMLVFSSGALVT
jgi:hypothetical protein